MKTGIRILLFGYILMAGAQYMPGQENGGNPSLSPDTPQPQRFLTLSEFYFSINLDSSAIYARKALNVAIRKNDAISQVMALYRLGACFNEKNQPKEALQYLFNAYGIARKNDYLSQKIMILFSAGAIYKNHYYFSDAARIYNYAGKLTESCPVDSLKILSYIYFGDFYRNIEDWRTAAHYYKKAIIQSYQSGQHNLSIRSLISYANSLKSTQGENDTIYTAFKLAEVLAIHQNHLHYAAFANIFIAAYWGQLNKPDSVALYCNKAMAIAVSSGNKQFAGVIATRAGNLYESILQPQKELFYHQLALIYSRQSGSSFDEATACLNVGKAYYKLGKYKKALFNAQRALQYFLHAAAVNRISSSYKLLQDIYLKTGKYKKAFYCFQEYTVYKNRLDLRIDYLKQYNLRTKYFTELKKENDYKKELDDISVIQRFIILLILFLVIILSMIGLLIILRYNTADKLTVIRIRLEYLVEKRSKELLQKIENNDEIIRELEEKQSGYRFLESNLKDVLSIINSKDQRTYISSSCFEMFGYSVNEMMNINTIDIIHPDFKQMVTQSYRESLILRKPFVIITKALRKDLSEFWLEIHSLPLFDENGRFANNVSVIRDITIRRKAEEELEFIQSTVDFSSVAIIWANIEGNFTYLNEAASHFLGRHIDELSGIKLWELADHTGKEFWEGLVSKLVEHKHAETEISITHNGEPVQVEISMNLKESADDRLIVMYCRDITERRRKEKEIAYYKTNLEELYEERSKALTLSENKYRLLVESVNYGIALIDFEGTLIFLNNRMATFLDYSVSEVTFNNILNIVPVEIAERILATIRTVITNNIDSLSLEHDIYKNRAYWYELFIKPFYDNISNETYALIILNDITIIKQSESLIAESEHKLKAIIDNMFSSFYYLDTFFRVQHFNTMAFQDVMKYSGNKIQAGESIFHYLNPALHKDYDIAFRDCLNNRVLNLELMNSYTDSAVWTDNNISPVVVNSQIDGISLSVTDITQRKLADLKLQVSEERYRAIVENNFDIIIIVRNDKVLFVNKNTLSTLEYSEEEIHRMPFTHLIHNDDKARMKVYEMQCRQDESFIANSFTKLITRNNHIKVFEFTAKSMDYEGIKTILFIAKDFTERIITEEELSSSKERALSDQINPDFVYDTLIAVKEHLKVRKPGELANFISDFSKLMRLYLSGLRKEFITLDDEIKMITFYLELQRFRYKGRFDYEIQTDKAIPENARLVEIPSLLSQPLIEYAVENCILNKKVKGRTFVRLDMNDERIRLKIVDNGPYIVLNKKPSRSSENYFLFSPFYEDRLNILSKKLSADFYFFIESGYDTHARMKGIITILDIPLL